MAIQALLVALLAGSAVQTPGRTVARVEIFPPPATTFVLQATVPVPRATFPMVGGQSPFAFRDLDGTLVGAQTEIVSRYAENAAGADVVEICARVHAPVNPSSVVPTSYDVVYWPHTEPPIQLHAAVDELLHTDRAIVFKSRDVFGNVYELNALGTNLPVKVMRRGHAITELRRHGSMMPTAPHGGANATLPHLFGIHTYLRTFGSAPFFELDVRVHNGHSGLLQGPAYDDPLGTVYFDGLAMELPAGWLVREASPDTASAGPDTLGDHEIYWIIARQGGGKMHVMHRQAQAIRRFVVYRAEDELQAAAYVRDANLGFCRPGTNAQGETLYSWWNADTARYSTQRRRLPDLSHVPIGQLRGELEADANTLAYSLRTGLATGYPVLSGALGWANPIGVEHGGMAGGDGIVFYKGVEALWAGTNAGWRALVMEHRMYTDRQPDALYNDDGEPTDYAQWVVHDWSGAWLPVWCFLTPLLWAADPFGFTTAPTFQITAVTQQNRKPAYDAPLESFDPIDLEHFVRYTAPAKALAWIGNDSLAKDALMLCAQLFRLSYNDLPNSQWGYHIVTGLGADEEYVTQYPGMGLVFGRLESWGLDAVISTYALADPNWRARVKPWFDRITRVLERGQSQCSGIIQAYVYEQLFNGQYRSRQSIEQAITENMLVSLRESVYLNADPVLAHKVDVMLSKSLYAMVSPPCWNNAAHAPWTKLALGDADYTHPPFCGATPSNGFADGGDSYQTWCSFAWGYDLTGDPIFLLRAAEMAGASTPAALRAALHAAGTDNLGNRAALIALLQELP